MEAVPSSTIASCHLVRVQFSERVRFCKHKSIDCLVTTLVLELLDVEVELLSFQNDTVGAAGLSRAGGNAGYTGETGWAHRHHSEMEERQK